MKKILLITGLLLLVSKPRRAKNSHAVTEDFGE